MFISTLETIKPSVRFYSPCSPRGFPLYSSRVRLYRTHRGAVAEEKGRFWLLEGAWEDLFDGNYLSVSLKGARPLRDFNPDAVLSPASTQPVWAAGVTYTRSRSARIGESKKAGGGDFYARVYSAKRPELFFKSQGYQTVGHRGEVRIRRDSEWNVPEPELALAVNAAGRIIGYTVGNDMSSRDIEGENPLYLPQAKVYDGSCALGPCVLVSDGPLPAKTAIALEIRRGRKTVFAGSTTLARMKRTPEKLAGWLYRETSFPCGCFLLTGTGVVPPDSFTLRRGDAIRITIDGIGTLANTVG
jgi:2-dehydro-3-deoxy-D-arabinonate dehydratase